MLSFVVLVISGFSLRFSEAWWVRILFGWEGGFELRGLVHRVAAVFLVVGGIWHVFYLLGHRGRRWLRDMLPDLADARHVGENIQYFLGRRPHEPAFRRFSYVEKVEYLAFLWGVVIMTGTGFVLWFENLALRWFPTWVLDASTAIHFYEAILASLAILVWHGYWVVFDPAVYPMDWAYAPMWYRLVSGSVFAS